MLSANATLKPGFDFFCHVGEIQDAFSREKCFFLVEFFEFNIDSIGCLRDLIKQLVFPILTVIY